MNAITFDTLSSARRLRDKGVPQEQAEAFADELRIANETERDISHLATRANLSEVKAELELKIEAAKTEVIKWVVGIGFAQIALVLTILKLH